MRSITWVLLLAFTVQAFVTQMHIHNTAQLAAVAVSGKVIASGFAHGKKPAENSTADCPFCQAIVHAGAFFAPAVPLLPVPASASYEVQIFTASAGIGVFATHGWQSRAPPQA